jgi:hypothetical protein
MYNGESATTKATEKQEAHENHEASLSVESPEEIREQMMTAATQETTQFNAESTEDIVQAEAQAEKDGLAIDAEDKNALQELGTEADAAKNELVVEVGDEIISEEKPLPSDNEDVKKDNQEKIDEKNVAQIVRAGQEKIHAMFSAGQQDNPEYLALTSMLLKQENGASSWKSAGEVDVAGIELAMNKIDQEETFQKAKDKIMSLHTDGNNRSSEYLELYSQLTDGSGENLKWKNASEIDATNVKKMLEAIELSAKSELPEIPINPEAKSDGGVISEKESLSESVAENKKTSVMKERIIENPELLNEKEASKKFLAEERSKLAEEIMAQRKLQRDRLSALATSTESLNVSIENMEGVQADNQCGLILKTQSLEANILAERVSSVELSEQDAQGERENISQLIANSENTKSLKAKLEEHYAKADILAKKRFETLNRSLEHVMKRKDVFLVHMLAEMEGVRHNANSNVSSETTYEDDMDIMLALEPSISTSSIKSGEKTSLWSGSSGFILGGGQIGEAGSTDLGSHSDAIKKRNSAGGSDATIEEIDEVVERKSGDGMNEIVVNNAEVSGYFQNAEKDSDGRFWILGIKKRSEIANGTDSTRSERARNAKLIQENSSRYRERFDLASKRGIPLYVMTPDREVYACLGVNDDGTVEIGKQLTPEEVATGRAGLSAEKRKEIGERLLEKKIFKKQETHEEAHEIIENL